MAKKLYEFDISEYWLNGGGCVGRVLNDYASCTEYVSCPEHRKRLFLSHEVPSGREERTGKRVTEYVPAGKKFGTTLYAKASVCSECRVPVGKDSNYCHKCGVRLVNDDQEAV